MERELPHAIYAAPRAQPLRRSAEESQRLRDRSFWFVGLSVLSFAATLLFAFEFGSRPIIFIGAIATAILALVSFGHACVAFAGVTTSSKFALVLASFFNFAMVGVGGLLAWLSTMTFTRGRQLRRFGKILLPPVEPGEEWAHDRRVSDAEDIPLSVRSGTLLSSDDLDDETRAGLAAQWRENGRTEHASVAAFARLTLDLLALGAPPSLVAAAQRDALDEIRHAEICFSLARAIDGKAEGPGAFPEASRARTLSRTRSIALVELGVDSLIDGALHEGVSARIVAKLSRRTVDPTLRAALRRIAADEGRHAAHGWDVVKWCLSEGGAPVAHALVSAVRALPKTMTTDLPEGAKEGGWERFGIMGHALERSEHAKARVALERRVIDVVASYRRDAA